jgi:hypothetical protein
MDNKVHRKRGIIQTIIILILAVIGFITVVKYLWDHFFEKPSIPQITAKLQEIQGKPSYYPDFYREVNWKEITPSTPIDLTKLGYIYGNLSTNQITLTDLNGNEILIKVYNNIDYNRFVSKKFLEPTPDNLYAVEVNKDYILLAINYKTLSKLLRYTNITPQEFINQSIQNGCVPMVSFFPATPQYTDEQFDIQKTVEENDVLKFFYQNGTLTPSLIINYLNSSYLNNNSLKQVYIPLNAIANIKTCWDEFYKFYNTLNLKQEDSKDKLLLATQIKEELESLRQKYKDVPEITSMEISSNAEVLDKFYNSYLAKGSVVSQQSYSFLEYVSNKKKILALLNKVQKQLNELDGKTLQDIDLEQLKDLLKELKQLNDYYSNLEILKNKLQAILQFLQQQKISLPLDLQIFLQGGESKNFDYLIMETANIIMNNYKVNVNQEGVQVEKLELVKSLCQDFEIRKKVGFSSSGTNPFTGQETLKDLPELFDSLPLKINKEMALVQYKQGILGDSMLLFNDYSQYEKECKEPKPTYLEDIQSAISQLNSEYIASATKLRNQLMDNLQEFKANMDLLYSICSNARNIEDYKAECDAIKRLHTSFAGSVFTLNPVKRLTNDKIDPAYPIDDEYYGRLSYANTLLEISNKLLNDFKQKLATQNLFAIMNKKISADPVFIRIQEPAKSSLVEPSLITEKLSLQSIVVTNVSNGQYLGTEACQEFSIVVPEEPEKIESDLKITKEEVKGSTIKLCFDSIQPNKNYYITFVWKKPLATIKDEQYNYITSLIITPLQSSTTITETRNIQLENEYQIEDISYELLYNTKYYKTPKEEFTVPNIDAVNSLANPKDYVNYKLTKKFEKGDNNTIIANYQIVIDNKLHNNKVNYVITIPFNTTIDQKDVKVVIDNKPAEFQLQGNVLIINQTTDKVQTIIGIKVQFKDIKAIQNQLKTELNLVKKLAKNVEIPKDLEQRIKPYYDQVIKDIKEAEPLVNQEDLASLNKASELIQNAKDNLEKINNIENKYTLLQKKIKILENFEDKLKEYSKYKWDIQTKVATVSGAEVLDALSDAINKVEKAIMLLKEFQDIDVSNVTKQIQNNLEGVLTDYSKQLNDFFNKLEGLTKQETYRYVDPQLRIKLESIIKLKDVFTPQDISTYKNLNKIDESVINKVYELELEYQKKSKIFESYKETLDSIKKELDELKEKIEMIRPDKTILNQCENSQECMKRYNELMEKYKTYSKTLLTLYQTWNETKAYVEKMESEDTVKNNIDYLNQQIDQLKKQVETTLKGLKSIQPVNDQAKALLAKGKYADAYVINVESTSSATWIIIIVILLLLLFVGGIGVIYWLETQGLLKVGLKEQIDKLFGRKRKDDEWEDDFEEETKGEEKIMSLPQSLPKANDDVSQPFKETEQPLSDLEKELDLLEEDKSDKPQENNKKSTKKQDQNKKEEDKPKEDLGPLFGD